MRPSIWRTDTPAPRAAIYARYSTDLQLAASIQDQAHLCRKLCQDNGWEVVEVFADEAMSGASHLRPSFQKRQQAAMNSRVDIVVAEALDRLPRDQEHIVALHKRMPFLDVKIVTKSEGEIKEMYIGLGGTMSTLFLKQLAQKTHRGLEGRVREASLRAASATDTALWRSCALTGPSRPETGW